MISAYLQLSDFDEDINVKDSASPGTFGNNFSKLLAILTVLSMILFGYSFIWITYHKKITVQSPDFKAVWGEAYSEKNMYYYLFYVLRSCILTTVTYKIDKLSYQIMITLGLNLLMTLYLGHY